MAFKFVKRKQKRACVIGLDGVPLTLLEHMMTSGVMPKTREITGQGTLVPMTVTLPEISSVSWSTFMTGKNPGEHGIFGFTDLKPDSYGLRFPNFHDLQTPTIWDRLGKAKMRSVVINQPSTYPARPIPGVLISGFVAIDLEKSVHPVDYLPALKAAGYEIDVETEKCRDKPDALFASLHKLLEGRRRVVEDLWEQEEWNLFEVVVTGTDRLHHFIWDAYEDASHPYHGQFLDYYAQVDAFIAYVFDAFQSTVTDGSFFILSDHGFCRTRREMYVNSILQKEGFLELEPGAKSPEGITGKTKAFALDPARIYINRMGRFPEGNVAKEDVEAIKQDIRELFLDLTIDGEKIVRRTFSNEEAYVGPLSHLGPDVLLVPENGYDLKGRIGAKDPIGDRRLQGMHTWDNAFFFALNGNSESSEEVKNIVDVPRIILRSLDVEL